MKFVWRLYRYIGVEVPVIWPDDVPLIDMSVAGQPFARYRSLRSFPRAILTPGSTDRDLAMLAEIARWYRARYVAKFEGSLSFARVARRLDVEPVNVRWAIDRLVALGLIAVQPGAGGRANVYRPCLPRRIAKSMSATAVGQGLPPF